MVYWPAWQYTVCGLIRVKYDSLGGPNSFLLWPASNELTNPDGYGKRSVFNNGPIYWSSASGAHPVVNHFFAAWQRNGWEAGPLGYPTTDEIANPGTAPGRRQEFQNTAAIYWKLNEAYAIRGAIRAKWNELGAEQGSLGYPLSDEIVPPPELSVAGTRMNKFEAGMILWSAEQGAAEANWFVTQDGSSARTMDQPGDGVVKISPGKPRETECPAETVHPGTPFNCEEAWPDSYDRTVVARFGRQNSQATPGHGAFGWMHALVDHNLDLDAMGKIINVSQKVPIGDRLEYQAEFKARGQTIIRAAVRTREVAMDEDGHLDEFAQGVVTGYCKTGSEAGEGWCPDWVNGTL
ncbi:hypothetical protein ROP_pROB01-05800 (plasmid) [Rhodococcus opacus B4]|uniref:Uncharacterized protein n=2 Tax=Rhodococcus opacus TaxID=37919 RepID=C1BCM4_RHOOB|nr:hypothetical protein ROP_pROB01-05800 [Rhodococcus opacus B4]